MNKLAYRKLQSLLVLLTFLVLTASFYFEFVAGMQPCPLCLMQRFCAMLFAFFCLAGLVLSTFRWARHVMVFQIVFAGGGLFFAARQVWLQMFPSAEPSSCMPDLSMMMRFFPWQDVLHVLFWGVGECGEVTWRWLGLPMPAWTSLYFLTMLIVSGFIFILLGRSLTRLDHKI